MTIPLSKPDIGEREIEYATRVLRTGRLSFGPVLEEFESRFAAYAGRRYAVATNSGTSALHLAVKALGIGPDDEVLTPSFSFPASANCLLYEHALPVFVDIDLATLNIDPDEVRKMIHRDYVWDRRHCHLVNRRSGRVLKGILPVHIFGLPCAMEPIMEIAGEFSLRVIEDACESLGAKYFGRHAGTFGDAAVFAFYPNKQITTAEGGMMVTDDPQIAKLCRSLRNQGRDDDGTWLCHVRLGYNYRLSDLHCALGVAQLERVDELLASRKLVSSIYTRELTGIPELILPCDPPGVNRSWFVYPIRLRALSVDLAPARRAELSSKIPAAALRDYLMAKLRERGIDSRPYFPAIHRQPYFQEIRQPQRWSLPRTELASASCLALPFFPSMTEKQVAEVCGAVRDILGLVAPARMEQEPQYQAAALGAL